MQTTKPELFGARVRRFADGQPGWPAGHGLGRFLAERYGRSTSAAARWLTENICPDDDVLRAMAADFGVSLGELRYGEPSPATMPEPIPPLASAQMTLAVHRVSLAAGISLESVSALTLDRLFAHLHGLWRRRGEVVTDDVREAMELLGLITRQSS